MFEGSWLTRKIVEMPAQAMCKAWPRLTSDVDPKDLTKIDRALRRTNSKGKVLTAMTWARLFGGAGALIALKNQDHDLEEELDLDSVGIGDYSGLIPFDRWSGITPDGSVCTDMSKPTEFGLPEFYTVRAVGGDSFKVHASRILRFTGPTVPTPEKEAYSAWGISVIEPVLQQIEMYDNVAFNILALSFRANILGMRMPELASMLSGLGGNTAATEKFAQRMQQVSEMLSNQSLVLLPTDGELSATSYQFGGLDSILMQFQLAVSAAAGIPVTRLWGKTYTGLGTGANEGDERVFEERIAQDQDEQLRPQLEKLYPVICASELGEVPDDLDLSFPCIRVLDETEKSTLAKTVVDSVMVCLNGGIMSPRTAAKEIKQFSDRTGFGTNLTDEAIDKLPDTVEAEGEVGQGLFPEGGGLTPASGPGKVLKEENREGKEHKEEPEPDDDDDDENGPVRPVKVAGEGNPKDDGAEASQRTEIPLNKAVEERAEDAVLSTQDKKFLDKWWDVMTPAERGAWWDKATTAERDRLSMIMSIEDQNRRAKERTAVKRHQAFDSAPSDLKPGDRIAVKGKLLTVDRVAKGTKDLFGNPTVQVTFTNGHVEPYWADGDVRVRAEDESLPKRGDKVLGPGAISYSVVQDVKLVRGGVEPGFVDLKDRHGNAVSIKWEEFKAGRYKVQPKEQEWSGFAKDADLRAGVKQCQWCSNDLDDDDVAEIEGKVVCPSCAEGYRRGKAEDDGKTRNELYAQYRQEAKLMFDLVSPTRLGWYCEARLLGKTPEQAIKIARPKPHTTANDSDQAGDGFFDEPQKLKWGGWEYERGDHIYQSNSHLFTADEIHRDKPRAVCGVLAPFQVNTKFGGKECARCVNIQNRSAAHDSDQSGPGRDWQGLQVVVESPKGTERNGATMPADYGYVNTDNKGADGDRVDCYLAGHAPVAYVVDQLTYDQSAFDEHKCVLGADGERAARKLYVAGHTRGKDLLGAITAMPAEVFKAWLKAGDTTQPVAWRPKI
jgi:hypothetical protein